MVTLAAGLGLALGSGGVSLADLDRFPPHRSVRQTWSFAHRHVAWLADGSRLSVPEAERLAWWGATAPRYNAWWLLDEATMTCRAPAHRRACLWELRLVIGPGDYAAGRMPLPVALRFFREY